MKIEIKKIDEIQFIPENEAEYALLKHWENKYWLIMPSCCELQTLLEIKKIGDQIKWKEN